LLDYLVLVHLKIGRKMANEKQIVSL
jgi:hypothetical protein